MNPNSNVSFVELKTPLHIMTAYLPGCKPPTVESGQSPVTSIKYPTLNMTENYNYEALKDFEEVKIQLEWAHEIIINFEFATLCDLGNVVRFHYIYNFLQL